MSWWLFQDLLNDELEEDETRRSFANLDDGDSLKIRWDSSKMGKGPAYAEASRIDFEERDEIYDDEFIEDMPNLDEVLKVLTYKELENLFFDTDDEDEDAEDEEFDEVDDDEKEEKPKRKKKTVRKSKPEPEEEDDDDDDDDEEDDDEEEEKPKKKRKPARKSKPEPEDDDDDDDDAEEEEEKPRRKKVSSKKAGKNKCPYGHKFGVDADEKEDCSSCDLWDPCLDEKEQNEN